MTILYDPYVMGQAVLTLGNVQNEPDSDQESEASNLSAQADRIPEQVPNVQKFDESVEQIVATVVDKLSTTLQTLCISERIIEARQSADDWKHLCNLMISNHEVINDKLSIKQGPQLMLKHFGVDMSDPSKITLAQFMASPISTPLWRLVNMFEITQFDPMLEKWWKGIKLDTKDPTTKLAKYLQAMNYFLTGNFQIRFRIF